MIRVLARMQCLYLWVTAHDNISDFAQMEPALYSGYLVGWHHPGYQNPKNGAQGLYLDACKLMVQA